MDPAYLMVEGRRIPVSKKGEVSWPAWTAQYLVTLLDPSDVQYCGVGRTAYFEGYGQYGFVIRRREADKIQMELTRTPPAESKG